MLDVMSELATTARPVGIVVKATRRVAVAVTIAIGVALLLLILWKGSTSVLFLRAIMLACRPRRSFHSSRRGPEDCRVGSSDGFSKLWPSAR